MFNRLKLSIASKITYDFFYQPRLPSFTITEEFPKIPLTMMMDLIKMDKIF